MFSASGKKIKIETPKHFYPLDNGDILIDCNISVLNAFHEANANKLFSILSEHCMHAMLYADNQVYHAASGNTQKVSSHDLLKGTHLLKEHDDYRLPEKHIVLTCKNQKLKKYMAEAAKVWQECNIKTPFTNFYNRPEDDDFTEECHLYRSFRAAHRNQQKLPLSKKRGVSCIDFLSYVIRAAIIQFLFSKEIPKTIQDKIIEIEKLKHINYVKALQKLNKQIFIDFKKLVEDEIKQAKIDMKDEMNQECIAFLQMEMKGRSLTYFCGQLKHFPHLFQFAGYLFFFAKKDNEQTIYQPYVMNHPTYQKWHEQLEGRVASRILNQEEFDAVRKLSEPAEFDINKRQKLK